MKTLSIEGAIRQAEKKYMSIEKFRDREAQLAEVRRLAEAGVTNATIAHLMGMSARNIDRIRAGHVEEPKPHAMNYRFDRRQDRADKLEKMAHSAFDLACRLRDEDPQLVWHSLTLLDRQRLQELTVILLAALPIEQPASEIFEWVTA